MYGLSKSRVAGSALGFDADYPTNWSVEMSSSVGAPSEPTWRSAGGVGVLGPDQSEVQLPSWRPQALDTYRTSGPRAVEV